MRSRIALLAGLALAGCAAPAPRSATYTCAHMRDSVGAFREQARLIVSRAGPKTSALSTEEAVLDVELLLRDACRDAPDGYRPYARVGGRAAKDR